MISSMVVHKIPLKSTPLYKIFYRAFPSSLLESYTDSIMSDFSLVMWTLHCAELHTNCGQKRAGINVGLIT
jgi:hypothetical protein